jgi:hypothetical protein
MLGLTRKRPDNGAAVDRLRHWTRTRFSLAESETIMAAEIACAVPGCPPIETHVVFWTGLGRHHFKIFRFHEECADRARRRGLRLLLSPVADFRARAPQDHSGGRMMPVWPVMRP